MGHVEKRLDEKDKFNFKINDVTTRKMKFGQLIEYNIRNSFIEKLCTKSGEETIPGHFLKKSRFSISLD